jgi:hypothetical protein
MEKDGCGELCPLLEKLPNLMDEDGSGELCPLVLPGVARGGRQQVPRAPAHRQRLPDPVPEEGFRLTLSNNSPGKMSATKYR